MSTRVRKITQRSRTLTAPATPITPMTPSTAYAITAAADASRRARPRHASRRGRVPAKTCPGWGGAAPRFQMAPPQSETAARVAAGAIARKIVPGMVVRGALIQIGPHRIDRARWDWDHVAESPFFCPDAGTEPVFEQFLDSVRKQGSSVGAVIEIVAEN